MVDGLEHHIKEHTALAALLDALDDMRCVPDPDPDAPEEPLLNLSDAVRDDQ